MPVLSAMAANGAVKGDSNNGALEGQLRAKSVEYVGGMYNRTSSNILVVMVYILAPPAPLYLCTSTPHPLLPYSLGLNVISFFKFFKLVLKYTYISTPLTYTLLPPPSPYSVGVITVAASWNPVLWGAVAGLTKAWCKVYGVPFVCPPDSYRCKALDRCVCVSVSVYVYIYNMYGGGRFRFIVLYLF